MSPVALRAPRPVVLALLLAGTSAALLPATTASPLELIFEPMGQVGPVDQTYGDRVTSTQQAGFLYGVLGGFTPHVTVDYGPIPSATPSRWGSGYGNLSAVLFDAQSGWGHVEISLAADPGWRVAVSSFDMAAWDRDETIRYVRVWNGAGDLLFDESDVVVPQSGHLHFEFDPPLEGRWVTVCFDAGNLGGRSDNVAIDNIRFSEIESPTPVEPGTWARTKAAFRGA